MRCPRCQHENPAGVKFCGECGAKLEARCPACGIGNPPGNKFCHECGATLGAGTSQTKPPSPDAYTPKHLAEKILSSRVALEGERKQVTVLFADVSGFTALAERLDPEDVHQLMNRAFELMLAEVHRYEGTVNQFLGDGIMALFGAPIAHEDHARRAVHAALDIRKALEQYQADLQRQRGITFQVRQGLNTGLVVVGSIGTDLRMDYTAVGDTTNVAARLVQAADPGRIVISGPTHRLVEGYFYTRPLGELALKGKAAPQPAWEVIAARISRTRLDVEAERGLTPFVGRDRELEILAERFQGARSGQGQMVFISGEPGIGKSRLLLEFRRRLGDEPLWLEGHCMAVGRSTALHPLIDMLRRAFRIEEGDGEEAIVRKIERSVLLLGEDLRPILPHLRFLFSVDPGDPGVLGLDPAARRAAVFDAVRKVTVRAAEVRPHVFVFEDLHWTDTATEEYLAFVADSIAASRALVILTYRPGHVHRLGERSFHTRLALTALSTPEAERMAEAVLATDALPDDLKALILWKTEGNPFFIEEVVRSLQETGAIQRVGNRYAMVRPIHEISVPDTIQDVIMARIDRLEEPAKKTLQLASVIGREFTRRLLYRIADIRGRTEEFLRELQAIELIYQRRIFPELAYMFKHALTHDVAYHSLLVQRRRELHRIIALAIEELYADRLAEHYEVLAYHFSKGEEWGRAVHYLRRAGAKALARSANREAVTHLDEALAALGHLPEDRGALEQAIDLRFELRQALGLLAEYGRALDLMREAEAIAERLGDRRRLGQAYGYTAQLLSTIIDYEPAVEVGQRALAIATELGDFGLGAVARLSLGRTFHELGDYRSAMGFLRPNVAALAGDRALERFGQPTLPSVASRMWLAWCHAWRGEFAESTALAEECQEIAANVDQPADLIIAGLVDGLPALLRGDLGGAVPVLERAITLASTRNIRSVAAACNAFLGYAYSLDGRLNNGIPLLEAALDIAASTKFVPCVSLWTGWLAEANLLQGRKADASWLAERSLQLALEHKESAYQAFALRILGELVARREPLEAEKAEEYLRQALAMAEEREMRPLMARCYVNLGQLNLRRGKMDEGRRHLTSATTMFREMDMPFWLARAEAVLSERDDTH
jgi:class 3 adenylate cyclase/tetratricopeptide (TPR) repeat protein